MMRSRIEYREMLKLKSFSRLNKKQKEAISFLSDDEVIRDYSGCGRTTKYYPIERLNQIITETNL